MATSNPEVSLKVKLLIDKKEQRVLFSEAGKDFVDFLFTLLSLPIGSVIRLLLKNGMVGALGKLYESIDNLSDTYLQPTLDKGTLLNPESVYHGVLVNTPLLLPGVDGSVAKKSYICSGHPSHHYGFIANDPRAKCPHCDSQMSIEASYVAAPGAVQGGSSSGGEGGGYVKDVVTYMVMDDLEVKPMSTISSITMLNSFNVKEIAHLEEKMVSLGIDEGLKLLKESLQSKNVLTAVFLGKKD